MVEEHNELMGVQRTTRWVADVAITLLSRAFVSDAAGLQGIECIDGLKDNFIIQMDAGRSAAVCHERSYMNRRAAS